MASTARRWKTLSVTSSGTVTFRWFDAEFDSGDVDQDVVISSYRSHLDQLHDRSSDTIRALIHTNLHDAQVRDWTMEGTVFRWSLVIGDLQTGYERATIEYHDAILRAVTTAEVIDFDLCDTDHELVSDEIDIVEGTPTRFEHRFSFWPDFAFAIQFRDVTVLREPMASRQA